MGLRGLDIKNKMTQRNMTQRYTELKEIYYFSVRLCVPSVHLCVTKNISYE